MSYILDALRKSERERRRGSVPDPLTVQEPLTHEKKRRAIWPLVLMAALLINAVILGLWFGSRYSQKAFVAQQDARQEIHEPERANNMPQSMTAIKDEQQHVSDKKDSHTGKVAPDVLIAKNGTKKEERFSQEKERTSVKIQETSPDSTISEPQAGKALPPPDKAKLYTLNELPSSIRQKLPDFSFSVFLYSDEPMSRTVRVNGTTMKEGHYLTDGLKLEEIIPDGVIFSYLDYRFRIKIQ